MIFQLSRVPSQITFQFRQNRAPAISAASLRSPAHTSRRRCDRAPRLAPRAAAGPVATLAAAAIAAPGSAASVAAIAIGWLVIAGSVVRSLPQILRIARRKSAEGLSLISVSTELGVYLVSVAYNLRFGYPFSTWGDTLMCLFQQAAVVGMVLRYRPGTPPAAGAATAAAVAVAAALLFGGAVGDGALRVMQASCAATLALGARLPQILMNWRRGNSGELSILSTGLSVAGNGARVFTTLALVGDPIILATNSTQFVLTSVLLWQCLATVRQEREASTAATPA